MSMDQNVMPRKPGDAIMQGWLSKRGEHIKNWRPRFFFLYHDGALLGFKMDPRPCQFLPFPPENDFKISHVQILTSSKRPSGFSVRCMQCAANEMIIRRFCANNIEDRDRWINAMTAVNNSLAPMEKMKGIINSSDLTQMQEPMDTSDDSDNTIEDATVLTPVNANIIAPVTNTIPNVPTTTGTELIDDDFENSCLDEAIVASSSSVVEGVSALNETLFAPTAEKKQVKVKKQKKAGRGLDAFEFLKVLGRGTFGKVILCREKKTMRLYALKILQKRVIVEKDEVEHTLAENRVLHNCRHPFLTRLEASFQTQHHLCYVLEFANGGELFFHLRKNKSFSETRTRFYGAEITLALEYLHGENIIYRDMKLENLLLDNDGHIKLADFGLCKEDIKYGDTTVTFCGTPEYLAPDILLNYKYGRAVDWWGLGVVMYEMVCGRLPFFSRDHEKLFSAIMSAQPRYPQKISEDTRDIFERLLDKDPDQRLGGGPDDAKEVKVHRFFRGVDWGKLYRKEYTTPFKPLVASETDTSYFDKEFTSAPVQLTPPTRTGPLDMDTDEDKCDYSAFDQFPSYDEKLHYANSSNLCEYDDVDNDDDVNDKELETGN